MIALLSYHWRSLFARATTTVLTLLVVAAVVAVFTWMLGFGAAMRRSFAVAGDPRNLLVLRPGATSESNSAIPVEDVAKLTQVSGIARDPDTGEALISPELMVQVNLPRIRDRGQTSANVAVRGVTDVAFKVHRHVQLLGPLFSKGSPEIIVGVAAAEQFVGLQVGGRLELGYAGDRAHEIVGEFLAGGGPMESEIWAYAPSLMDAYNRTMYSSVSLRLQEGVSPQTVIAQIEGPAIQLTATTEPRYWQEQSRMIKVYLTMAYVLIAIMCLAAIFSIANAMFSAVAGRTREIAMLRAIGFSRWRILTGFVLEAVILSLAGGLAGCLACALWLEWVGNTKDMFGANTFTTLAFEIRLTPVIVMVALGAVTLVGMIGAVAPARRAARIEVVSALRQP